MPPSTVVHETPQETFVRCVRIFNRPAEYLTEYLTEYITEYI